MNFLKKHFTIIIIIILSLLVIGLTIYAYWKNNFLNPNYFLGTDKLGDFGSFIGGFLGTLITLLATVYVYKTYISQKKELKKQKKQLKLQSQLIAQQQFESTFFNMLNVHRELKNNLELKSNIKICNVATYIEVPENRPIALAIGSEVTNEIETFYKGVKVFDFIRLDFEVLFKSFKNINTTQGSQTFSQKIINEAIKKILIEKRDVASSNEEIEIIRLVYKITFTIYKNVIGHYCRNVYHILKFIRESEYQSISISYRKYADKFQSQLNMDEQFILFYNFILFDDKDKGIYSNINLVNHYRFLENLGNDNLLDNELHNNEKIYNFDIK